MSKIVEAVGFANVSNAVLIKAKDRRAAKKIAPWAAVFYKLDDGQFLAFRYKAHMERWINRA